MIGFPCKAHPTTETEANCDCVKRNIVWIFVIHTFIVTFFYDTIEMTIHHVYICCRNWCRWHCWCKMAARRITQHQQQQAAESTKKKQIEWQWFLVTRNRNKNHSKAAISHSITSIEIRLHSAHAPFNVIQINSFNIYKRCQNSKYKTKNPREKRLKMKTDTIFRMHCWNPKI